MKFNTLGVMAAARGRRRGSLVDGFGAVLAIGDQNLPVLVRPETAEVNEDADHQVALTTAME